MASVSSRGRSAQERYTSMPDGEEVASFSQYLDAKKAIDRLLEGGIPPASLAIVGHDVRSVERITGRYGYGRAALSSALTGSWVGLFFGLIVVSLGLELSLTPVLAGIVIGAGVGMIIGMLLFSSQRSQRPTFRSMSQVIAADYRVVVAPEHQGKAKRVLQDSDDVSDG